MTSPRRPDRNSPLPLWAQVLDDLRRRLAAGEFADGFPADAPTGRAATSEGPIEQVGVDRCAGLLREVLPVTDQAPTQVGFARVGSETVLVYEFTAAPDRAASTTTTPGAAPTVLTTAVRPQACDPLFVFQR